MTKAIFLVTCLKFLCVFINNKCKTYILGTRLILRVNRVFQQTPASLASDWRVKTWQCYELQRIESNLKDESIELTSKLSNSVSLILCLARMLWGQYFSSKLCISTNKSLILRKIYYMRVYTKFKNQTVNIIRY